jgi:hypothetical protein
MSVNKPVEEIREFKLRGKIRSPVGKGVFKSEEDVLHGN